MTERPTPTKTPLWVTILIIILILPVAALPSLLSNRPEASGATTLIWLYPVYTIAAGICAHICYPTRRETAWILLVILALSHIGIWILSNGTPVAIR